MPITEQELHSYARAGAAARIRELEAEIAAIRAAFPGLRGTAAMQQEPVPARRRRGRPPRKGAVQATVSAPATQSKKRNISAAQRKAISVRMKKRWVAFRAERAKAAKN